MTEPSKLQRWLDLIAFLATRWTPAPFEEIAQKIPAYKGWDSENANDRAAIRRKFERDKDELRNMGIPIKTVTYNFGKPSTEQVEGYAIFKRDFYLPYLKLVTKLSESAEVGQRAIGKAELTADEAPLVLEALRRVAELPSSPFAHEARSAFRKLAFDLDPGTFGSESSVLFVEQPNSAELVERLRTLSDALLAKKRVRFRYHGIYRGQDTEREVNPFGLLFQEGHWYLIAFDPERNDRRVFRVGRMEDVQPNKKAPHTPDYEVPSDFRLDEYVGRKAWELGDPEDKPLHADVLFRFPLSLWAERNHHGELTEALSDGHTIRRFAIFQVSAFLRWILGLGGDAEIQSPAELKTELRKLAQSVARTHGGASA